MFLTPIPWQLVLNWNIPFRKEWEAAHGIQEANKRSFVWENRNMDDPSTALQKQSTIGAGRGVCWGPYHLSCRDEVLRWDKTLESGQRVPQFQFSFILTQKVFQWCCGFSIVIPTPVSKLSPILLLETPIRTWFPAARWCHCYFDLLWVPFLEGVDPHVIHLPRKTLSDGIISLWELREKSAKHWNSGISAWTITPSSTLHRKPAFDQTSLHAYWRSHAKEGQFKATLSF